MRIQQLIMSLVVLPAVLLSTHAAAFQVERAIEALEDKRYEAMKRADREALEQLLADDLTYVHTSGRVETKSQFINSIESGEILYRSIDREDVQVRIYGSTAVVTGLANVTVELRGRVEHLRIRFIDVYVRQNGRWNMVAWQSTRLADPR